MDLGVGDLNPNIKANWNDSYNLPAYTPPEIIEQGGQITHSADVYGLVLLLYEMLAGRPAYEYHLRKDEAVFRSVLGGEHKPTGRIDLKGIPETVEKAIQRNPRARQPDVLAMAGELKAIFPENSCREKAQKNELESCLYCRWRLIGHFLNLNVRCFIGRLGIAEV